MRVAVASSGSVRGVRNAFLAALLVASGAAAARAQVTVLYVDDDACTRAPCPGPDGTPHTPFARIADALAAAKGLDGTLIVRVAAGTYANEGVLSLPPGSRLVGSTRLKRDARGLPTGVLAPEAVNASVIVGAATNPLVSIRGDDVIVTGMALRGTGVTTLMRIDGGDSGAIRGVELHGNLFERGILRVQKASVTIDGTLFRDGTGVAALVKGGYEESPSRVVFSHNRVTNFTLNGIHFDGEYGFPTDRGGSAIFFDIGHSDFSGNGSVGPNALKRFGTGLQFFIDDANDQNLAATQHIDAVVYAYVHDNTFNANHNYGVVVSGRVRSAASTARLRFVGDFTRNEYCGNGNNKAMFGFTFFGRSLHYEDSPGNTVYLDWPTRYFGASSFPYEDEDDPNPGSIIEVDSDDLGETDYDFDNSEYDPDSDPEFPAALENTLLVNGVSESGVSMTQTFDAPVNCQD